MTNLEKAIGKNARLGDLALSAGWFLNTLELTNETRQTWAAARPHLFSGTRLWVDVVELDKMAEAIQTIETVLANAAYQAAYNLRFNLLPTDSSSAIRRSPGVLFGYDFHLSPDGPKLIEINTNAGGAFLNACLGDAWQQIAGDRGCAPTQQALVEMFQQEWRATGSTASVPPGLLVIVDESPESQYLYPEFLVCAQWLAERGWKTAITDPAALAWDGRQLSLNGQCVSMVYNRLTDFYLADPACVALRSAYQAGAVLLTPQPSAHAQMADKRHLVTLADADLLEKIGIEPSQRSLIAQVVPAAIPVRRDDAESLWNTRKQYFFKPVAGFGSRAAYRGDKLTRRVFDEVLNGDYIVQTIVPPSERVVQVGSEAQILKVDVRCYTYCGQVLGVVGRLYQGQTTNFRTPGGGFAPVYCAAR